MTDSMTTMSAAVASLVVAGLGVYAYTQLGAISDKDTHENDTQTHVPLKDTRVDKGEGRKARRKRKGKVADIPADVGEAEDAGEDKRKESAHDLPGGFRTTSPEAPPAEPVPANAKAKKKKKKADKAQEETQPDVAPDVSAQPESTTPKKKKKKAQGKEAAGRAAGDSTDADASVSLSPSASSPARAPQIRVQAQREMLRSLSLDTDGSWTHVDRRRLNKTKQAEASSDLASTESSSPITERMQSGDIRGTRGIEKRTLAEKLVPRPEETHVDDMLEQPNFPTLARVMRVQPPADESPVPGFSWEDYGDVVEESVLVHDADQEDEGEWGIVKSRSRTRPTQTPATATAPQVPPAPETMTKKQRQNARKRELVKAVKAETEAARLQGLAKHKRELERLRIIEQSQQGGGKQTSGGMHATVDDRGKLVWE